MGLAVAAALWGFVGEESAENENLPVFSEPSATAAVLATMQQTAVEFPCVLRDTGLIVQHLAQYEGPFLEADTQEQVAGVAALMVYNPGRQSVASAELVLTQGTDTLSFHITFLLPGSKILVLEKNGHPYSKEPVTDCCCLSISTDGFGIAQDKISVMEEKGQLVVKNVTDKDFSAVMLYYKQYAAEGEFFLGGRTCKQEIKALRAGESKAITPYYYAAGHSRVVAVVCEE